MAILALFGMSALLGLTSFAFGMLPLCMQFSEHQISLLSRLGTGILLGASLGVIIPEGVEALIAASKSSEPPSNTIALSLLTGFAIMMLIEQLGPSHGSGSAHHATRVSGTPDIPNSSTATGTSRESFDVELAQLESDQGPSTAASSDGSNRPAYPLTIGLVIHGIADGVALGVSAFPSTGPTNLSLVVWLALAIHKAPTALAFTISLLSTSLSLSECRKHLLIFSISTPVGAMVAYMLYSATSLGEPNRIGTALLISGGSFLYVATVLQPVAHGQSANRYESPQHKRARLGLLFAGFITPFILSTILEHGH